MDYPPLVFPWLVNIIICYVMCYCLISQMYSCNNLPLQWRHMSIVASQITATEPLVQQLVTKNLISKLVIGLLWGESTSGDCREKIKIKFHVPGPFWGESLVDSSHKGPMMQKVFLCHEIVMLYSGNQERAPCCYIFRPFQLSHPGIKM